MLHKKSFNQFTIFLGMALLFTCISTAIGLIIYYKTGSYALDLSRPNYQSAHKDINYTSVRERPKIESVGEIDQNFLDESILGLKYYTEQIKEEIFTDRVLSDDTLGIILNDSEPLQDN